MKRFKKVHSTTTVNNYFDEKTGELKDTTVDTKHTTVMTDSKEDFFLTFAAVMGAVKGLTPTEEVLIRFACLNCQMNRNEIVFNKPTKERAASAVGVGLQSIADAVSKLKKKGVFIPLGSGGYLINPEYYWRGNSGDRKKVLEFMFTMQQHPKIEDAVKPNTNFEDEK